MVRKRNSHQQRGGANEHGEQGNAERGERAPRVSDTDTTGFTTQQRNTAPSSSPGHASDADHETRGVESMCPCSTWMNTVCEGRTTALGGCSRQHLSE